MVFFYLFAETVICVIFMYVYLFTRYKIKNINTGCKSTKYLHKDTYVS